MCILFASISMTLQVCICFKRLRFGLSLPIDLA